MQALSLAVGPAGVAYFTQQMLVPEMTKALSGVTPPGRTIPIPDFITYGGGTTTSFSNISIALADGSLSNFRPGYQSITQKTDRFVLTLIANSFNANYAWHEWYDQAFCGRQCYPPSHSDDHYSYSPGFGSLTTVFEVGFQYDTQHHSYDVVLVGTPKATPAGTQANIPGGSVIQNQDTGCFSSHVSDATASAVSSTDFTTPIANIFQGLIKSIAASGHLTPDIVYDFAVGDSPLSFPGGAGLALGVTGTVTYKGTAFPGTPPTGLPVPPPPTDHHHLQVYVSGYEFDALYWAFYRAGQLAVTVEASDLTDPDVLKCKTYAPSIKAFQPYSAFAMRAGIAPKEAPRTAFQQVWVLTSAVMARLEDQVPSNVYTLLEGLGGNAYAQQSALETDLRNATIDHQWWPAIERAASVAGGMVVTQNLEFTLTILNGAPTQPTVVFDLARVDILQNLGLGSTGQAQTLTFTFVHVNYTAAFVSSTVPNFDGPDFGTFIWPTAGEPRYDEALTAVGKAGAPLPIMAGFQFLFTDAVLNIQEGYVSVLAQVSFKSS